MVELLNRSAVIHWQILVNAHFIYGLNQFRHGSENERQMVGLLNETFMNLKWFKALGLGAPFPKKKKKRTISIHSQP